MANFLQWHQRRNSVYCLYYVCGEETCLQELVIQTIRATVKPGVLDYYTHAGTDKIADIMDTLTRELSGDKKLVIIRDGQKIKNFDYIVKWAGRVEIIFFL